MKSIVLLLAVCSVAQATEKEEKIEQLQLRYEEARTTCVAKHHLTEAEAKALGTLEVPNTRNQKCALECLLTETGVMVEGKYNREASDNAASIIWDDEKETLEKAKSVSQQCEKEVEALKLDDSCEEAYEILRCLRITSKKMESKASSDY